MNVLESDVVILGAGFGGSLTALLVEKIGLRTVLIDRGHHPRFAIGESSTPVANYVLRDVARAYGLPRIEPLAKYGTWQRTYPHLVCGLKRGFSYFGHVPHMLFAPREDHGNELLVAASDDDEHADTHWLRADVDLFLASEACHTGVPYFDDTTVSVRADGPGWFLEGVRHGEPVRVAARFLVDATGEAAVLPKALGIRDDSASLETNSRGVFAHFSGMQLWRDHLQARGADLADHPFGCDDAALHQILDDGWMWQLRFRNGVVSAGFALDAVEHPLDPAESIDAEWNRWLARYPSIAAQFETAQLVQPPGGLRRTGRLQRRVAQAAGVNWALLPNTAGFIDPLHSTGIGHTLCGMERLVRALADHWGRPARLADELGRYSDTVLAELAFIDRIVSGCYVARRNFRLFAAYCMLYFAAATTYERRRAAGQLVPGAAFLCADDPNMRRMLGGTLDKLRRLVRQGRELTELDIEQFEQAVASGIRPYNSAGLCDPAARNMYRYTAAPCAPQSI
jgi:FADH2 O2-dependent halogenase